MDKQLEELLYRVEKPARYIGNEVNSYNKEITDGMVRFGFAFPDIYEVGMSHLGMHILYHLKNQREDIFCERIFSPWVDMEALLREQKTELFTLESKTPIRQLDFVGFTLQYELSYTNILNILDLGNIPLRSKDRTEEDPIILAGGPCAYNPEPIAEIIDLFIMGEGEEVNLEVIDLYKEMKAKGMDKEVFLYEAGKIGGVYVPKFYDVTYNDDGTIQSFEPNTKEHAKVITKRIIEDFDSVYYPDKFLVPFIDIVHDRAMVEIFRGCTAGCRFCQAGMIYRPVREKSVETINKLAQSILASTGYDELAFSSLSTLDYTEIEKLVYSFLENSEESKIGLSLPSLRLNSFTVQVMEEIQKIRKTGLTFAPEAGTQRLRDVINKGVTEEDLTKTMESIFSLGWNKVKLYFMMGLPTETYEDLEGIMDLGNKVAYIHKKTPQELKRSGLTVTISTSCFVPKPFTPFQWEPQNTVEEFEEKQKYLRKIITNKKVRFTYHDATTSFLEGVVARGDRRLNEVIIKAYEKGCKFDGWQEYFDYDKWMSAFEECGVDPHFYANRRRSYDEILPWDHISIGVDKGYLIRENENSKNAVTTVDCRQHCTGCGVNSEFTGRFCK